jgi:hypothetical protein
MIGAQDGTYDMTIKRLGLLHQAVPDAAIIGVLINPKYSVFEEQS